LPVEATQAVAGAEPEEATRVTQEPIDSAATQPIRGRVDMRGQPFSTDYDSAVDDQTQAQDSAFNKMASFDLGERSFTHRCKVTETNRQAKARIQ
jgi:hypothetical protein